MPNIFIIVFYWDDLSVIYNIGNLIYGQIILGIFLSLQFYKIKCISLIICRHNNTILTKYNLVYGHVA